MRCLALLLLLASVPARARGTTSFECGKYRLRGLFATSGQGFDILTLLHGTKSAQELVVTGIPADEAFRIQDSWVEIEAELPTRSAVQGLQAHLLRIGKPLGAAKALEAPVELLKALPCKRRR